MRLLGVLDRQGSARFPRELDHRRRADGAFDVAVQLDLRYRVVQVGHRPHRSRGPLGHLAPVDPGTPRTAEPWTAPPPNPDHVGMRTSRSRRRATVLALAAVVLAWPFALSASAADRSIVGDGPFAGLVAG